MTEDNDCDLKEIEYAIALHFALAHSHALSNVSDQTKTSVNTAIATSLNSSPWCTCLIDHQFQEAQPPIRGS